MTSLTAKTIDVPASVLGGENPLADLPASAVKASGEPLDATLPPDEREYARAARPRGCLPYRVQDQYDRSDSPRPLRVAVLENQHLRATFLLAFGGRLWSLVDKASGRELLYQPDVLHLANVALRNAWFCGGVEWNIAVRGHTAHTCAPVFAAEVRASTGSARPDFGELSRAEPAEGRADDGWPTLRLWEYDRFRGLVWQIDALLADDVPALFIRPRVVNPNRATTPMYWWSNIAVEEAEGHRVVVPADQAFQHGYQGCMDLVDVPIRDGVDTSYATRIPSAHDYFYSIPEGNRPWIACLDGTGAGLIQCSTARLGGRKLFVWGMGRGGRRWQEHLGGRGRGYVEIQAGLARTQSEYVPMPAGARWEWLEAYMPIEADPAIVHGSDWPAAYRHVQQRLDAAMPQERLERMLAATAALADRPPKEILHRGSGWGALECRRARADGGELAIPPGIVFGPEAETADQAHWTDLLDRGSLPCQPPDRSPGAYQAGAAWRRRLEESIRSGRGDHWLAWLHAGAMAFADGDIDGAEAAWRQSLQRQPSAWAARNLAVLARHRERPAEAAELYLRASRLMPRMLALQVECGRALVEAERFDDLHAWLAGLPPEVAGSGRIRLLAARDAFHRGQLDAAQELLDAVELPDIREGEIALTDLWFEIQARRQAAAEGLALDDALRQRVRQTCTPPKHLDYRMA